MFFSSKNEIKVTSDLLFQDLKPNNLAVDENCELKVDAMFIYTTNKHNQ